MPLEHSAETERPMRATQSILPFDADSNIGDYDFRNPVDIRKIAGNDPLLPSLLDTPAFRRLKDICFLGGIDYCFVPQPNGQPQAIRYTRQQHSLGVLRLANLYCAHRQLPRETWRIVCAAALLHDIGHPPFSHSMEPVFEEAYGLDHHRATADIICGRVPLGKDIFKTLRQHGVDPEEVAATINSQEADFEGFFNGPINFDTIEGICRSYGYFKPHTNVPSPETVAVAALRRGHEGDRAVVDHFWRTKDEVYRFVVHSRKGVLADLACQTFLRSNIGKIGREGYFRTELDILRLLPDLRSLLTSPSLEEKILGKVDTPICYTGRSYHIVQSANFFAREDGLRYRHERHLRILPRPREAACSA